MAATVCTLSESLTRASLAASSQPLRCRRYRSKSSAVSREASLAASLPLRYRRRRCAAAVVVATALPPLPLQIIKDASICFVDSEAGVKAAVAAVLASSPRCVALDLEGCELGRLGAIATLQMCDAGGGEGAQQKKPALPATTRVVGGSSGSGDGDYSTTSVTTAAAAALTPPTVFVLDIAALGSRAFAAENGLLGL